VVTPFQEKCPYLPDSCVSFSESFFCVREDRLEIPPLQKKATLPLQDLSRASELRRRELFSGLKKETLRLQRRTSHLRCSQRNRDEEPSGRTSLFYDPLPRREFFRERREPLTRVREPIFSLEQRFDKGLPVSGGEIGRTETYLPSPLWGGDWKELSFCLLRVSTPFSLFSFENFPRGKHLMR